MGGGHPIQPGRTSGIPATSQRPKGSRTPDGFSTDLQSLLAGALKHLAESTGSTRACAWSRRPDGESFVVAAVFRDGTNPESPDTESLAALATIERSERPIDLGQDGEQSPLATLALRHGFGSAMPLLSAQGEAIAMLMLGGPEDLPGRVRPRTLAALGAAVDRLRTPAIAATAFSRLTRLDAAVCRLDRLAVIGDLLAEVTHEIRNPLVSIKTFLDLLPDHLSDPEFTGDFRTVVLQELKRMERLLDTILDHARPVSNMNPGSPQCENSRIEQVFGTLVRLLGQRAAERNIEIYSVLDEDLPEVEIGDDALRQILLNLILNALEASPPSSRVTLHAEGPVPTQAGSFLEFSVTDEGDGVPEELRTKLFEPFFTSRANRTGGLGLAISKKLVEEAGGSIRVDPGPTGGARFCVRLPCGKPATGSERED